MTHRSDGISRDRGEGIDGQPLVFSVPLWLREILRLVDHEGREEREGGKKVNLGGRQ